MERVRTRHSLMWCQQHAHAQTPLRIVRCCCADDAMLAKDLSAQRMSTGTLRMMQREDETACKHSRAALLRAEFDE